jgi:tyrosine-protein phosphatase YwqE
MNNLFSRNKINIDVEMHCHILPAVGCDPEFTNQALDVLAIFQSHGVNTVYATPHVRLTRPSNTHESILERTEVFKKQIAENKIKVKLEVVAEYYVDEGLSRLIDSENLLTYPQSHVLVELPLRSKPDNLDDVIKKLCAKGYKPVIAHPELHHYLRYDWKMIADLKGQGCLFQINLINMAGYFGEDTVVAAGNLLRSKTYDFAGTGAHSREQLQLIAEQVLQNKDYVKLLRNADFTNKLF